MITGLEDHRVDETMIDLEDHMVDEAMIEEIPAAAECMMRFVQIVAITVKFLLCLALENLSTAVTVLKTEVMVVVILEDLVFQEIETPEDPAPRVEIAVLKKIMIGNLKLLTIN